MSRILFNRPSFLDQTFASLNAFYAFKIQHLRQQVDRGTTEKVVGSDLDGTSYYSISTSNGDFENHDYKRVCYVRGTHYTVDFEIGDYIHSDREASLYFPSPGNPTREVPVGYLERDINIVSTTFPQRLASSMAIFGSTTNGQTLKIDQEYSIAVGIFTVFNSSAFSIQFATTDPTNAIIDQVTIPANTAKQVFINNTQLSL